MEEQIRLYPFRAEDRLLTLALVAARMRVSIRFVRRLIRQGRLPVVRLRPSGIRFVREGDYASFLTACEVWSIDPHGREVPRSPRHLN